MNIKAKNHFKLADPILFETMTKLTELPDLVIEANRDYFLSLVREIVSQQLSGKAADTIFGRFKLLFNDGQISPELVMSLPDDQIRAAGLSYAKIKYLKDLSTKVINQEIDLKNLASLSDEEVLTQLVTVKGIGPWTAEMFLIFTLGREDVFSHGDLGLRNAIKKIYALENPTRDQIEAIVSLWSPYKSYGSRILWQSLDNR